MYDRSTLHPEALRLASCLYYTVSAKLSVFWIIKDDHPDRANVVVPLMARMVCFKENHLTKMIFSSFKILRILRIPSFGVDGNHLLSIKELPLSGFEVESFFWAIISSEGFE